MTQFIEVPWRSLSDEALRGVIEDFVTRDGTDYGAVETPVEQRVAAVKHQLERDQLVVIFDNYLSSIQICALDDWRQLQTESDE